MIGMAVFIDATSFKSCEFNEKYVRQFMRFRNSLRICRSFQPGMTLGKIHFQVRAAYEFLSK